MDKTRDVVFQQIRAMGARTFEIGLFKPDGQRAMTEAAMIPRTWDTDSLIRSLPWLKLQNLQGRNIYVRPKGEHNLSLVDDLNAEALKRMEACGFKPAVTVETSAGNFQAWLKHPEPLPKEMSTAAARNLAEQFGGDKGAADWRHFGRLAGFTNRKQKYQSPEGLFPFVRLISASGTVYPAANKFVAEIESKLVEEKSRREQVRANHAHRPPRGALKTIDEFRLNSSYGGDGTRIDIGYAIYALSHGKPDHEVEAALRSRDLSHKGNEKRQEEYINRTIKKALEITSSEGRALSR